MDMASRFALPVELLTSKSFQPFGNVISCREFGGIASNQNTAVRFDDVAGLDLTSADGAATVSLYRVEPASFPLRVARLEQHPLSTQMFVPMSGRPFLVIVAGDRSGRPDFASLRAFRTDGDQAVNYHRAVWHHPVIALDEPASFVMVGRRGPGVNFRMESFAGEEEAIIGAA